MSGITSNYNNNIPDVAVNDIYLDESGNIATNSGNDEIIENCFHAIQLWYTEYGYNTQLGINWLSFLQSNKPAGLQIKQSVTSAILSVNGVNKITSYNMEVIDRVLLIEVGILLNSGVPAIITGSF